MLIALVMPAWRRFSVTRLCLSQRLILRDELAGRGHKLLNIVVADDENLDLADEFGFESLEVPNSPLGSKWNDGIEYAAKLGADYIAVIGSDDWVHSCLFDVLPPDSTPDPDLSVKDVVLWDPDAPQAITGREIMLVDLKTSRGALCRVRTRTGVIPWIFPRKALAASNFRPVKDWAEKGLDGSLLAGLGVRPTWIFRDPHPAARVDFKSATNLNSYELIAGAVAQHHVDPWQTLSELYPPSLVRQARELAESM